MLTEQNLNTAVLQNIITPSQRGALIALARGSDPVSPDESTDEALRLVGGGNDLFVTVGVVLLLSGLFFVLTAIGSLTAAIIYSTIAVVVWVIAEIVTRQKRMRLSSTVLAVLFMGCVGFLISQWILTNTDLIPDSDKLLSVLAKRGEIA